MRRKTEYRYMKLANLLRDQISTGLIKPGEYIMPEHELSKTYEMSRTSVRKSLDELVQEGLIEKEVGRGTKVKPGLVIEKGNSNTLSVLAPEPSFFMDFAFSIVLDAFKKKWPHVDVKVVNLPNHQYQNSIRMTDDMGFKPDLVLVTDREFMQTVPKGEFHEVETQSLTARQKRNIYPKLWSAFQSDGKLLGAPLTFSPVFLAYNESLFQQFEVEAPRTDWTIHDFIRAAAQLTIDTNKDGIIDQYGFSTSTSMMRWPIFLLRNGAVKIGMDTDLEVLQETLTFIHDLIYRYKVAHLHAFGASSFQNNPFIHGKVAMTLTTLYEMSYWMNQSLQFEPLIAPMPFGKHDSTMMMANALMIPNNGPINNWAQKFVQVALSEQVQQEICAKASFLSVYETVNERVKSESFLKKINIYRERMQQNFFWDELVSKVDDLDQINNAMQLFWYGMESAEQTVKRWQTEWIY